jgi:hypothetical protein
MRQTGAVDSCHPLKCSFTTFRDEEPSRLDLSALGVIATDRLRSALKKVVKVRYNYQREEGEALRPLFSPVS